MNRIGRFIMGMTARTKAFILETLFPANLADCLGVTTPFSVADDASLQSASMSIIIWVKTTTTTNFAGLVDKTVGSDGFLIFIRSGVNHFVEIQVLDGTVGVGALGTSSVGDGNWHMVGGTFNNSTNELKIYVDGVLETTVGSVDMVPAVTDLLFGGNGSSVNELDGGLGYFGYFDADIGATKMLDIYNSGVALEAEALTSRGLDTDIVTYIHLANRAGSTGTEIEDRFGSNDATNLNATAFDESGLDVSTI